MLRPISCGVTDMISLTLNLDFQNELNTCENGNNHTSITVSNLLFIFFSLSFSDGYY